MSNENIVYISIPEEMETQIGDFVIDPSILLPVELPEGSEEMYLSNLSWEMIIAAMLKILAFEPEHEHADYYKSFVLAVKPDILQELSYSGIIKAQQKEFALAEEIFLALTSLVSEDPSAWINLALVYEQRADAFTKAEKEQYAEEYRKKVVNVYNYIFEHHPDLPEAHLNAGYFFIKLEGHEKARHHLKQFLLLSKNSDKSKDIERVLEQLDERNKLDNLFKEAYDYIKLGNEQEGISKIQEFIQNSPDVQNAWFLLGWAFRRIGNYREGKRAFLKAIELEAPHPDLLNELAICLMELGEYRESRKQLRKALRLEPENVKIISNLGILALKENNREDAIGFFRTVLEIDPEDPIAKQYLSYLTE